jgi:hypothetical protein
MAKQSFRARQAQGPKYPRLADLETVTLRKWGLTALGGLLLGSAACNRPTGELTASRAQDELLKEKAAHARAARAVDSGAPAMPAIEPPGQPPMLRVQPHEAAVPAKQDRPKTDKKKPKPRPMRRAGVPEM